MKIDQAYIEQHNGWMIALIVLGNGIHLANRYRRSSH